MCPTIATLNQHNFEGHAKFGGNICDVPIIRDLANGRDKIYVRLVNQNGWKFQDILIVSVNGHKVNFFLSWYTEHQVWGNAILYSGDAAQAAKQIADAARQGEDLIDALVKLQKLFASQNPSPPVEQKAEDAQ